jgi:hypothetical protein
VEAEAVVEAVVEVGTVAGDLEGAGSVVEEEATEEADR